MLAPSKEAFDTPLSLMDLSIRPGPATGRSDAYPDGTCTRWSVPTFRTHHLRKLGAPTDDSAQWDPGDVVSDPALAWDIPNLSRSFPLTEAWNDDDADPTAYRIPERTCGLLYLIDRGCALWTTLVITGDAKGTLWQDNLADNGGIIPLGVDADGRDIVEVIRGTPDQPATFTDFYCAWLSGKSIT